MDNQDIRKQTRAIMNQLITYQYSQIFDIAPAERQLHDLCQIAPNAIEPLIGTIFTSLMQGNRKAALIIAEKVWNIGGDISPFFELIYTDCLLNLGEIEKAGILVNDRLLNIIDNLPFFYPVVVKYALTSCKMNILKNLSEYEGIYDRESDLFDFAANNSQGLNLRNYQAVMKLILSNLSDCLCSFDYILHFVDRVEIVFYTSLDVEQNEIRKKQLFEKINAYFLSMQTELPNDFTITLKNIKLHPSWAKVDNEA